jgi:hypothetical protein
MKTKRSIVKESEVAVVRGKESYDIFLDYPHNRKHIHLGQEMLDSTVSSLDSNSLLTKVWLMNRADFTRRIPVESELKNHLTV